MHARQAALSERDSGAVAIADVAHGSRSSIAKVWYRVLGRAGMRQVRVHDLRHTYASLLLEAGEPMLYVKDQLGHSTIQTTIDLYGHLKPGKNREAVGRLAALTTPSNAEGNTEVARK